uniref:Uncharacterized protein n=1 Tax=Setaria italica TaxID=4555 RepID=K3YNQ6_SETIT
MMRFASSINQIERGVGISGDHLVISYAWHQSITH